MVRHNRRKYASWLFGIAIVSLIIIAFTIIFLPDNRFSVTARRGLEYFLPDKLRTIQRESECEISLFFSPCNKADPDGIDDRLVEFINSAKDEIKAAIYSLNLGIVTDALINAKSRGVSVFIVYDESNPSSDISKIVNKGISVVFRSKGGGYMHNKFVIIDEEKTWTGSLNFTINGVYKDNNNAFIIKSKKIAADYLSEFDEMQQSQFGGGSPRKTPYPNISIDCTEVEVYFAPEDNVEDEIASELARAKKEIVFMVFSFTSERIADVMSDMIKAGVKVKGIFEKGQRSQYSKYDYLKRAGADVKWDSNPYNMHHKVIIIDRSVVITGSYNFSKRAERENDENCIIFHNPGIAEEFIQEYERLIR
jgi:phosphatidylserine/phosphatidylglycerophosphate/cardiolipin synthase-like enzyme